MNQSLDPFWVFTLLGAGLSIFLFSRATTLYYDRSSWTWRDLAKRFYTQAGILSILIAGVLILFPAASIKNIEPYPYLKLLGFVIFMATLRSVTELSAKINSVDD